MDDTMDSIRKVTQRFDNEFENWVKRTKMINNIDINKLKGHKTVRKANMELLAELISVMPPIKINTKPQSRTKKISYEFNLKGKKYEGLL